MKENPIVGSGTSLQAWNNSHKLAQLPVITVDALVPVNSRAVIIAPHPDDEILGCGGLMRRREAALHVRIHCVPLSPIKKLSAGYSLSRRSAKRGNLQFI